MTESTVIIGGAAPQSKPAVRFPCMRWNPETGESKVCNKPSDIPPGWIKRHPKDPKHIAEQESARKVEEAKAVAEAVMKAPAPKPPKSDKKRAGIIAELTRRGLQYDANAATDALYAQLIEEVEKEA